MKKFVGVVAMIAVGLLGAASAAGAQPPAKSFVAVLNAAEEVPLCPTATNASRGVATFHVRDEATGTVDYKVVSNNLPGSVLAAHIHEQVTGVAGPIVQGLDVVLGAGNGVIGRGTFVNPGLVDDIRADPAGFYVNVHTQPAGVGCPSGVIRGQLDDHGPANN